MSNNRPSAGHAGIEVKTGSCNPESAFYYNFIGSPNTIEEARTMAEQHLKDMDFASAVLKFNLPDGIRRVLTFEGNVEELPLDYSIGNMGSIAPIG